MSSTQLQSSRPTRAGHPRLRRRLERAGRDPERDDPPRHRREPLSVRLIGRVFEASGPLLGRVSTSGGEHIPADGPVIVAGNHISDVDPFLLGKLLQDQGRYGHFLVKEEVFRVPVLGDVLENGQLLEVRRGTPAAGSVLEEAAVLLARGEAVALYPEGKETLDPDYWPLRAQPGVAALALATGAPVLPVAIWGSQQIRGHEHSRRLVPRQSISLSFGPLLSLDRFRGERWSDETLDGASDEVLGAILDLLIPLRGEQPPTAVAEGRPGWPPGEAERRAREVTNR